MYLLNVLREVVEPCVHLVNYLIDSIDARVVMMDPKTRSINPTVDTYEGYCQYLSKVSL